MHNKDDQHVELFKVKFRLSLSVLVMKGFIEKKKLHVYISYNLHTNSAYSRHLDCDFRNHILSAKTVKVYVLIKIQAFKDFLHGCFNADGKIDHLNIEDLVVYFGLVWVFSS